MKKLILFLALPTYIFAAELPKPRINPLSSLPGQSSVQVTIPPMQILDINPREFLAQLFVLINDAEFLPGTFENDLKKRLPDQDIPALLAKATEFARQMLQAKIKKIATPGKPGPFGYIPGTEEYDSTAAKIRKAWGVYARPLMTLYYTIYYQAQALHASTVEGFMPPEKLQETMGIEPEVSELNDKDKDFLKNLAAFLLHGDLPEDDVQQKLFVTQLTQTQKLDAKEITQLLTQAEEYSHKVLKYRVIRNAPIFDEEPEELSAKDVEKVKKLEQIRKDWAKTTAPLIALYYTLYYQYKAQHPEKDYDIQEPEYLRRWLMGEGDLLNPRKKS